MKCLACSFENLPGLERCARCGSALTFDNIAVEPPRASHFRFHTRVARVRNNTLTALPNISRVAALLRKVQPEPIAWKAVWLSIIPGLGHFALRAYPLAAILLGSWLLLLLLSLLTLGLGASWYLFNLAIAIHAGAVLSLFAANLCWERLPIRMLSAILVYLLAYYALYAPVVRFASQFLALVPLQRVPGGALIRNGDVVVAQGPWTRAGEFARGELVLYQLPAIQDGNYYLPEGLNIDRIVAIGGDQIGLRRGVLTVNGHEPPKERAPIGRVDERVDAEWEIGPAEYLIVPSTLNWTPLARFHRRICVINADEIVGRVFWRLRPWSRMGRLE